MSEVWVSLIDMMRLKALSSVSVMLLAMPQSRNSTVTRQNGSRYFFSIVFINADKIPGQARNDCYLYKGPKLAQAR